MVILSAERGREKLKMIQINCFFRNNLKGEIMDSLKNSPITNLPGGNRHHDEAVPIADLNPYSNFGDSNLF